MKICIGKGKKSGLAELRTDDGWTKSCSENANMLINMSSFLRMIMSTFRRIIWTRVLMSVTLRMMK